MNANDEIFQKILKSIQESNDSQTKELKTYINQEILTIEEAINQETRRINALEEKYKELEDKYRKIEKTLRKNNIIIFGLHCESGDLLKYTIEKLNTHLQISLTPSDVNNIFTIGKQPENKPVIVQFTSYLQKLTVLKNCKKLKKTGITISEERTLEEREELKILQHHLKKARSKKLNCYIRGMKLYINGESYVAGQLIDEEDANEQRDAQEEEVRDKVEIQEATEQRREIGELTEDTGNQSKKRKIIQISTKQDRCSPRIAGKSNATKENKLVSER